MFELFTEMHLPTKDIYTHNLVLLVLGTTVNCLAVWVDGVFGSFACPVDIFAILANVYLFPSKVSDHSVCCCCCLCHSCVLIPFLSPSKCVLMVFLAYLDSFLGFS